MVWTAAVSVLFLVLDGMPARHVGRRHTPTLAALAAGGGWAPMGGRAVAPSSTYPNHATFVTGVGPERHGVHGNHIVDAEGVHPASAVVGAGPMPLRGVHGGPRQNAQVAVCGGGHPAVAPLAARLSAGRPAATDWHDILLGLLTDQAITTG